MSDKILNTDGEVELKTDGEENEENEAVYIKYDIASYPSDLTLKTLKDMWESGSIVIPTFQRKFVWKLQQSSLLIDSFLCGLPVPPVFFYINKDNENVVIDGQQRILSIVYFINGYFGEEDASKRKQVFRLKLPKQSPYYDKTFSELEPSDQRKLLNSSVLRAMNIKQLNPDDDGTSSYYIFERLNKGGTPLKEQEIRNCVYSGDFMDALKELNEDSNWRKIIGSPIANKHQKDVELILRVFSIAYDIQNYEKPMKEFLNKNMKKHRKMDTEQSKEFINKFKSIATLIIQNLGEKPFHIRGPVNVAALESVMATIVANNDQTIRSLKQKFATLISDSKFIAYTSNNTSDKSTVEKRYELANQILLEE